MSIAVSEAQRAVADAVRGWAAKASPIATARAQETDPDRWRKHWDDVAALGLFTASIPEELGGAGGTAVDLAVLLEAAAEALVPGPVAPTGLAALLLARARGPAASELLPRLGDGTLVAAVATDPGRLIASAIDGGYLVTGTVGPVAGVDPDGLIVAGARTADGSDVWFVAAAGDPGVAVVDRTPTDFSRSLADVRFDEVTLGADRVLALDSGLVADLAATVSAAEAAGIAAWCVRTAVDYAGVREQFGKPIGSFQAVKHLCAEMLCRAEQATALAWDAAEAIEDTDQRPIAAAAAAALALDAAVDNAKDCIQVLGGIGFTWEHDAHLYLRRAIALRQLAGGAAGWRRRVADLTLSGARRELHIDLGERAADEREAVRSTVATIATLPADEQRAALAEQGYLAPHWPAPYGLGADAAHQLVIAQELQHAGVSRPDLVIGGWAIPTILSAGTDAQKERFVAPTLRGELVWCQLFSEPGAGSDLASLRTRAERTDDGGWRITGQKVWTSVAHRADWGICLARTNPDAPKHKGISYFLVDMRSPGLDIRSLREITGEAMFNEVFLDDVFVPDELVVGEIDDGWRLARSTLVNERIAMSGGSGIDSELEAVLELARRIGADDDSTRERLGRLVAESVSGSLLDVRATLRQIEGRDVGAEASVRKLIGVRHRQAVAESGLEMLGADAAADSEQVHQFLMTRCLTIAGGTTQVLLTLAAERILGLPRS